MSSPSPIWHTLGIPATIDQTEIRRAYAARLKATHPEDDPEGFKALRAAYESAMQFARLRVQRDPEQSRPAPPWHEHTTPAAAAPRSAEVAEDPELVALRNAFRTLHQYLRSDSKHLPEAAGDALSRILASHALENVTLERRVEYELADMLASNIPAADSLLLEAVERFGWTRPQRQLNLTPAMTAILTRVRDLAFLESLQSDRSPYSHAFRGLRRRKFPVLSWIRAHIHKSGRPSEFQLLQLLRIEHPTLLPLLNANAVAWWDQLASRPQLSFVLLVLGIVLTLAATQISEFSDGTLPSPAVMGGNTAAFFAVLLLGKLYLVDWPRHLIRRKWPAGAASWLRLGWLPLCLACLLLSAVLPSWRAVTLVLGVVSLSTILWALLFRPVIPKPPGDANVLSNIVILLLVHNLLVAMWWVQATGDFPEGAAQPTFLPAFAAMIISVLGLPGLLSFWVLELQPRQRSKVIMGLMLLAIIACVLLWTLTAQSAWRPISAALALIAIVLHRPMSALLSRRQQEFRFGWMILGFIGLIVVAEYAQVQARGVMLVGFGLLLVTAVILCMAMALWNEWRGATATALQRGSDFP